MESPNEWSEQPSCPSDESSQKSEIVWPNRALTIYEIFMYTWRLALASWERNISVAIVLVIALTCLDQWMPSWQPQVQAFSFQHWQLYLVQWLMGVLPLWGVTPMLLVAFHSLQSRPLSNKQWFNQSWLHMLTVAVAYAVILGLVILGCFLFLPGIYLLVTIMPVLYYATVVTYNPFQAVWEGIKLVHGLWWYTSLLVMAPMIVWVVVFGLMQYNVLFYIDGTIKIYLSMLFQTVMLWLLVSYFPVAIKQLETKQAIRRVERADKKKKSRLRQSKSES